jgi:hypothetical protein
MFISLSEKPVKLPVEHVAEQPPHSIHNLKLGSFSKIYLATPLLLES